MNETGERPKVPRLRYGDDGTVLIPAEYLLLPSWPSRNEATCATCCDQKWIAEPGKWREPCEWAPCPHCNTVDVQKRVAGSGIPARYQGATFMGLNREKMARHQKSHDAAKHAYQYAKGELGAWLVLCGEQSWGAGKTHLACCVLRHRLDQGDWGKFISFPDWLESMRPGRDERDSHEAFEEIAKAPFLIVDDLGAEKGTEWVREQTIRLVDRRYRNNLDTVWTANVALDRFDGRVFDRLSAQEEGFSTVLDLSGVTSYRSGHGYQVGE